MLVVFADSVVFGCLCRQQARYGSGASHTAHLHAGKTGDKLTPACMKVEEQDGFVRRHDTDDFSANLQAEEVARYAGELKASKKLETVVCNELQAAQIALHECQIKNAQLNGSLTIALDEKARSAATEEQLRLETARLKLNVDRLCSATEGGSARGVTDTLVDEVKELRLQLAAVTNDKCVENTKIRYRESMSLLASVEVLWQCNECNTLSLRNQALQLFARRVHLRGGIRRSVSRLRSRSHTVAMVSDVALTHLLFVHPGYF